MQIRLPFRLISLRKLNISQMEKRGLTSEHISCLLSGQLSLDTLKYSLF